MPATSRSNWIGSTKGEALRSFAWRAHRPVRRANFSIRQNMRVVKRSRSVEGARIASQLRRACAASAGPAAGQGAYPCPAAGQFSGTFEASKLDLQKRPRMMRGQLGLPRRSRQLQSGTHVSRAAFCSEVRPISFCVVGSCMSISIFCAFSAFFSFANDTTRSSRASHSRKVQSSSLR